MVNLISDMVLRSVEREGSKAAVIGKSGGDQTKQLL